MPELPEVEVVRRGVEPWVLDAVFERITVVEPRSLRRQPGGAATFTQMLLGVSVRAVERRGKYLWLRLTAGSEHNSVAEDDFALVMHLGMSGQILVDSADHTQKVAEATGTRHLRVVMTLRGAQDKLVTLRFVDQRIFGWLAVCDFGSDGKTPTLVSHIALDPFDESFDSETWYDSVRGRNTSVKRALLNQEIISGFGNIYADESLYEAQLHYAMPVRSLDREGADQLVKAGRRIMERALSQGGTSFDGLYVNVNGASGYFDRSLHVYGRAGKPCHRCGTLIARDQFMNRSSYFCPQCQPLPAEPRW